MVARAPHLRFEGPYQAADLPAHFQLKDNPRIAPVWVLPELGWHVLPRKKYELTRPTYIKGDHGYDPALPAMHGIFVASGPSFKAGGVTEAVLSSMKLPVLLSN